MDEHRMWKTTFRKKTWVLYVLISVSTPLGDLGTLVFTTSLQFTIRGNILSWSTILLRPELQKGSSESLLGFTKFYVRGLVSQTNGIKWRRTYFFYRTKKRRLGQRTLGLKNDINQKRQHSQRLFSTFDVGFQSWL